MNKQTVSVYRSVRLTEKQWTAVLMGLGTAIESLEPANDDNNIAREIRGYAGVHNKIAEQLGRAARE